MVLINLLNHVEKCYSNDDGRIIFKKIKSAFSDDQKVTISLKGITTLNSSFVNSAFIELLDDYDFDFIRKNLSFIDSTKQINRMIKDRFLFEINRKKSLVSV